MTPLAKERCGAASAKKTALSHQEREVQNEAGKGSSLSGSTTDRDDACAARSFCSRHESAAAFALCLTDALTNSKNVVY